MKKISILFVVFLAVSAIAAGCAGSGRDIHSEPRTPYTNITPEELKRMLEKKDFLFVDVHVPEQKHIAGTDLFVPYNEIERNIDKFPSDKTKKIVLYCRSGSMSIEASQRLIDLGYKNIYNLQGGVYAWEAAGYSVE